MVAEQQDTYWKMIHQSKRCCEVEWNLEHVKRCPICDDVLRVNPCDCDKCTKLRDSVKAIQKKRESEKFEYF